MDITQAMTIIATILLMCTMGAIMGLFSYLLDYCFWDQSIFKFYLPFLAKVNLKFFKPEKLKALSSAKQNPEYGNMLIQEAGTLTFYKILGGCIVCTNIWLAMISSVIIHHFMGLNWLYYLPYVLFSSFILRRIAQ